MKTSNSELSDARIGFYWISRALATYEPSWKALLAYVAISAHVRNSSSCQESIPNLAKFVGIGQTAFRSGLKELEKKKAIQVKRRRRKVGSATQQLPSAYVLIELKPQRSASAPPEASPGPSKR